MLNGCASITPPLCVLRTEDRFGVFILTHGFERPRRDVSSLRLGARCEKLVVMSTTQWMMMDGSVDLDIAKNVELCNIVLQRLRRPFEDFPPHKFTLVHKANCPPPPWFYLFSSPQSQHQVS